MRDYSVSQLSLLLLILLTGAGSVSRADAPEAASGDGARLPSTLLLAQNEAPPPGDGAPPQGRLLLPNSLQTQEEEGRNCMTVCAAWGEDCTYINRGMGGTTRTCRRVCQQFTEECF